MALFCKVLAGISFSVMCRKSTWKKSWRNMFSIKKIGFDSFLCISIIWQCTYIYLLRVSLIWIRVTILATQKVVAMLKVLILQKVFKSLQFHNKDLVIAVRHYCGLFHISKCYECYYVFILCHLLNADKCNVSSNLDNAKLTSEMWNFTLRLVKYKRPFNTNYDLTG